LDRVRMLRHMRPAFHAFPSAVDRVGEDPPVALRASGSRPARSWTADA
jgi:hypothetical protein